MPCPFLYKMKIIDNMKKTGIFYGSETGTTKSVAERIAKLLNVAAEDVHDVADTPPSLLGDYELDVVGSSTWGSGELEQDWYGFIDGAKVLDLKGHKIAIFGCGDESMSDTFCDAVGEIYDELQPTGAQFIGEFNADGYDFLHSAADKGGKIVGLLLDEVNHPELTDNRIKQWTYLLKNS